MTNNSTHSFLLETYETEILKISGIWSAFPESQMTYRPHPKSRSVIEQMEHQVQSEGRWMSTMLGIDLGNPNPGTSDKQGFIDKYRMDAGRRLQIMRGKPDEWWSGPTDFFDVIRSHAWVLTRRITHSTHHRGMLTVYLRLLDIPLPSVYGPTADTDGVVVYAFND